MVDRTGSRRTGAVIFADSDSLRSLLGRPALQYVLVACSGFEKVIVAASCLAEEKDLREVITASGAPRVELLSKSPQDNLVSRAFFALGNLDRFIAVRGDLPLLTKAQLERVDREVAQQQFPALTKATEPPGLLQQLRIADPVQSDGCRGSWALGLFVGDRRTISFGTIGRAILSRSSCPPPAQQQLDEFSSALVAIADPVLQAAVESFMQQQLIHQMQQGGVRFQDSTTTHIDADVSIEPAVHIGVGVQLYGRTHIQQGTIIEGPTYISSAEIGPFCHIKSFCHLEGCSLDESCQVGPYARLRPGAVLEHGVFLGNFVEVKNSCMGAASQASHLAYIGDADVGERALIAAGCITCNYDGQQKHRTTIGPAAFVGSNSVMVAPVEIGQRAIIGAGSTITQDVPMHALGIARSRQRVIEWYAERPGAKGSQDWEF